MPYNWVMQRHNHEAIHIYHCQIPIDRLYVARHVAHSRPINQTLDFFKLVNQLGIRLAK